MIIPSSVVAIGIVLLVQIAFAVAVLGLITLKKYMLKQQQVHFVKSLDDLDKRLKKKQISEQTYQNMRYDLEKIYLKYFEKW